MLTQVKIVKKITGLLFSLRVRTVKTPLFVFLFLIAVTVIIGQAANGTMADSINRTSTEYLAHTHDPAFAGNMSLFDLDAGRQLPGALLAGITTRVSIASDGTEGNGNSNTPSISADGRYVSFESGSTNLVPGDTNGHVDIFVHDQLTGQTNRVSIASDGTEGNGLCSGPSISADGRYIAYASYSDHLVPDDTNETRDIFVHDQQTGQTSRISVSSEGAQANNESLGPSISVDGRYLAFTSLATNLVPGDTNNVSDVFVHDRQTGQTDRVSVASDGTQANFSSATTYSPQSISADGRYVVFTSLATNLAPGSPIISAQVFVHDRVTGQTSRVSVNSDGIQGNGYSQFESISTDGRYVAFQSDSTNLVLDDNNEETDIFVHDRQTGQTERVSVASDGTQGNGSSGEPLISANGRYVTFTSIAHNLVPDDTNDSYDNFVHDRQTGQTERVSVASDGAEGNSWSLNPSISGDGRFIAFYSGANNLVSNDYNSLADIFVHDRGDISPSLFINYPDGQPGSYFTVTGSDFPLNSVVTLTINGLTFTETLTTDGFGTITFLLSTAEADPGRYFVTVTANSSATVSFDLDPTAPLRPQEGTEPILNVPTGIAFTEFVFLPLVQQ